MLPGDTDALAVSDLSLVGVHGNSTIDARGDWRTVGRVDNLLQAIWLRLNTPEGALTQLGHPDYGSRLRLLIGEIDNRQTQERARLYVARALHRESRIKKIIAIDVQSAAQGFSGYLRVSVSVIPLDSLQPLVLNFPILLDSNP